MACEACSAHTNIQTYKRSMIFFGFLLFVFTKFWMHWPFFDIQPQFISSKHCFFLLLMIACLILNGNARKKNFIQKRQRKQQRERSSHLWKKEHWPNGKTEQNQKKIHVSQTKNERKKQIDMQIGWCIRSLRKVEKISFFHQFACTLIDRIRKYEKNKNVYKKIAECLCVHGVDCAKWEMYRAAALLTIKMQCNAKCKLAFETQIFTQMLWSISGPGTKPIRRMKSKWNTHLSSFGDSHGNAIFVIYTFFFHINNETGERYCINRIFQLMKFKIFQKIHIRPLHSV